MTIRGMRENSHACSDFVKKRRVTADNRVDAIISGRFLVDTFGSESFGTDVIFRNVDSADGVDRNSEALSNRPDWEFRRFQQLYDAFAGIAFNPGSATPEPTITEHFGHSTCNRCKGDSNLQMTAL
jgi:hypothetical protein